MKPMRTLPTCVLLDSLQGAATLPVVVTLDPEFLTADRLFIRNEAH